VSRIRAQWILRPIEHIYYQVYAALGQLVRNQRVGGSIPLAGSPGSPFGIDNPPYALPDERAEARSHEITIDK
jgi:hypothetical protein